MVNILCRFTLASYPGSFLERIGRDCLIVMKFSFKYFIYELAYDCIALIFFYIGDGSNIGLHLTTLSIGYTLFEQVASSYKLAVYVFIALILFYIEDGSNICLHLITLSIGYLLFEQVASS